MQLKTTRLQIISDSDYELLEKKLGARTTYSCPTFKGDVMLQVECIYETEEMPVTGDISVLLCTYTCKESVFNKEVACKLIV
jgi:hypothetical protein